MKKLMFAAAAIAAGVAMADISSSNIVGYQNKDVSRLLSNQIVTFEKVGGEGSDITEFYPVDENGDKLAGEVTAQFYSDKGKLLEEYCW